ncbi:MAG: hypothetical protein DSZ06_01050 [Sulfurospirillum sp.]|nr:MAG: hypothetical protein DSZ06_01050 [Sulfurospirillum sp.]
MLAEKLQTALLKLDRLIEYTKEDIELVKASKHDEISNRVGTKERILLEFESAKTVLNSQLMEMVESGGDLESVLDENEQELFDAFKTKLLELKKLNRDLSAIVVVVSEFYRSLFSNIVTFDTHGYNQTKPHPAAMLRVSA